MNAPVIWIFAPALFSLLTFGLNQFRRLSLGIGILSLGILAFLAWKLPIGVTFYIGSFAIRLSDTFTLFGRHFTLSPSSSSLLILLYLIAGLWFTGALATNVNRLFPSMALGMVSLLVAALMVDPFLYAALLIEIAILISLPMLVPPGTPVRQGVLRYLIFQTLAMPFILFTGWMLSGVEAGTADPGLTLRAAVLLGFGFAFLLAIFPFFSWIPLITEQNEPYIAGFLFLMLQSVSLLFAVKFIDQYSWLRDNQLLYQVLQITGLVMVVTGGILAAFQTHLGRIFGFAVVFETGISLLALSLLPVNGLGLFNVLFLPRTVNLCTWALGLSILNQECGNLSFQHVQRTGRSDPLLAGCILLANLSVVGFPLLASFPARFPIWQGLIQQSPLLGIWGLVGSIGLFAGAVRSTNNLFAGDRWDLRGKISWFPTIFLGFGVLFILILGTQPQRFLPALLNIANAYPHLLP